MASTQVNLYEAETQLSSLVDRAAQGEEIVIAKDGKPLARLAPLIAEKLDSDQELDRGFGKNFLGVTYIADDFDAPLPEDVLREFGF